MSKNQNTGGQDQAAQAAAAAEAERARQEQEAKDKKAAEEAEAARLAALAAKEAPKTVKMYRTEDEAKGGPTTADVHPDEVVNYSLHGWRAA